MPDDFNPYHKWLGIPPNQQPADHYRLLGIVRGECDPDVITHAAEQRTLHLKSISTGQHGELSRLLIDEVSRARNCLLDAEQKTAYDKLLHATQNTPPFPEPPPLHSSMSTGLFSGDDEVNSINDAGQHHPYGEDDNSSPLAINIDTGNDQRKKKSWSLEANKNKLWEDLDDQLADLSGNHPSEPDFATISVTGKSEQVSPPIFLPAESEADESSHIGPVDTPAPPSFPSAPKVEEPHAISQITENAESFPAPPPLPPENHSVDFSFAQQNPFSTVDDGEGELANGVSFSNTESIGAAEPKSDLAKSTRKKEKRIQLIGHLVAPIMGLIIGWIILQYLKTK
ncbi:MAG: hypothetical protein VXZ84_02435 [Planctomycetota bacterium]|nr:hypothetical protein [Planctomycetota bacterium]